MYLGVGVELNWTYNRQFRIMFVRKGTVRRGRGSGFNRRSGTRKGRTDSNESSSPNPRGEKRGDHLARSLNGGTSPGDRLSPSSPYSATKVKELSPHKSENVFCFDESRISAATNAMYKTNMEHLKILRTDTPSPARSLSTTVVVSLFYASEIFRFIP